MVPGAADAYLLGRPVGQIGIVVRELESACRRYSEVWGCGPWRVFTYSGANMTLQLYRGEPTSFAARVALNQGTPQLELVQPLAGPSVYDPWLERGGEGLHHLAVMVESADEAIESMRQVGYPVIQQGRGFGARGDGAFVYFDTERDFGFLLEALEVPRQRRDPELVLD